MKTLIPSKDVRELVEKTGKKFTDFEKAVLIYNGILPYYEKLQLLKELLDSSEDYSLREMLKKRISRDEEDIKCFEENTEGYVYILNSGEFSPEDNYCGCFVSAEMAYNHGLKSGYDFSIEKYLVIGFNGMQPRKNKGYMNPYFFDTKDVDTLIKEYEDSDGSVGRFYYTQEGVLKNFFCNEIERDDKEKLDMFFNPERFENSYIDIPNPFEAGDIVRLVKDNSHGVVVTSQEEWTRYKDIMKNSKNKDFVDASITVDFLLDNGHISHNHINPIFLERYEPMEDDIDKELLYAAMNVYKGGGLDWFTDCYDMYKKICLKGEK